MQQTVYKIAKAADWREAIAKGHFSGSADDVRDGFIHLSTKQQLRGTLEKHFRGETDLVLIAFEQEKLGPELRWEASRGGDIFPHLYGNLPASQMLWQRPLPLAAAGDIPLVDEQWFTC
jgi:uncharacterized protein (DUF952 family)